MRFEKKIKKIKKTGKKTTDFCFFGVLGEGGTVIGE
jgi:hypothetical protein